MSTDTLPETQSDPQWRPGSRSDLPRSSGRWLSIGLFAIGLVIVLAVAAALIPSANSSPETGPRLTYKARRADLIVTVIEEGTLESSENTEIKCQVRGQNTVISVVESGTYVEQDQILVQLDTLFIEEQIAERSKYAHWSRSGAERSKADVERATLAVSEYEKGRFIVALKSLEKDLAVSQSSLRTAQNMLNHVTNLQKRGYRSALEVEEKAFRLRQAELDVEVKETEIDVLKEFTRAEQMETVKGNLLATEARHKANAERAMADASRRDRALVELGQCVIRAERAGLVIYPSAAAWKNAPDIEEGATVHKNQVLLLMPELKKMQVKVGIHESMIDRVKPGLRARVRLPDRTLDAEVSSVATITQPAGWWTGGVVKYDTIIKLPSVEGLKPGMSAEVEIILAEHSNELTVPVAAVVETADGVFCWVQTSDGPQRRAVQLGDSNDVFIVIIKGLKEGDEVVLNPIAFVEEAQSEVLKPRDKTDSPKKDATESGKEVWPPKSK